MRLDELKPALKDDILFAGKTEEAFSKYRKVSFLNERRRMLFLMSWRHGDCCLQHPI
jgi:hypothetical protein